jgi:hypothetical protein
MPVPVYSYKKIEKNARTSSSGIFILKKIEKTPELIIPAYSYKKN